MPALPSFPAAERRGGNRFFRVVLLHRGLDGNDVGKTVEDQRHGVVYKVMTREHQNVLRFAEPMIDFFADGKPSRADKLLSRQILAADFFFFAKGLSVCVKIPQTSFVGSRK